MLRAAIGAYPHTRMLLEGQVASDLLRLEFADMPVISRAFGPMVREARFDVCETALATFLQAKACGKPLVLLPVVLAARFQQAALRCPAGSPIHGPADLAGRRVGVRAYSQTTGMWLRGILAESEGVRPADIAWVTFEGAHVAEIADPPWAARAPAGSDMLAMLRSGELDAAIVGSDVPSDPGLRTVFPDPGAAGQAFFQRHGLVPVNHVLSIRHDLAARRPDLVAELLRMMRASAAPQAPASRATLRPAIELALRYMADQDMLPRPLGLADIWEGLPAAIA